jgi:hypothetical protein
MQIVLCTSIHKCSKKKTILIKFHNLSHTADYMQILMYSDDNIFSFST